MPDINCSLDYSSLLVKNSIIKPKQDFDGFFSSKCASQKEGLSTCKPNMQEVGFIFFAELFVPNIFKSEKSIVDFSIQLNHSHADLTGLYIYVKCKMNFKKHTYHRN